MLTATGTARAKALTQSTIQDPILEAIERHRLAWLESARAQFAADQADENRDSSDPEPIRLVTWRQYQIGGQEIESTRERLLKRKAAAPRVIEKEYRAAKAEYENRVALYEAWEERTGMGAFHRKREMAYEAEVEAAVALTNVTPTTLEGVTALLGYVDSFNRGELRISESWYSNSELWPDDLMEDDAKNGRGNTLEMPFAWWIARNAYNALSALLPAPTKGRTLLHA
ncbi:MAG: hypothetical protein KF835_00310 [Xanthobacteraceae bacterium]|nr:hypothetical protein [Xanthobacteraceae bacterium]